jgi:hypothetical protein
MDWIDLASEMEMVGSFECGNELLGSVKCWKFLDWRRNYTCSRKILPLGVIS